MRDILLALIVFGLLPFILRKPVWGAYAWAWLSLMSPHKSAYGFARTLPFAYMVALVTLVGLMFSRERRRVPWTGVTIVLVMLLTWMTVTCFFAMNTRDVVLDRWIFV